MKLLPERIRGQTDIPLNGTGRQEMDYVGQRLAAKGGIHRIYTGDLKRNTESAQAIARHTGATVRADPILRAMDYGRFQGQLASNATQKINHFIVKRPDKNLPWGRESFNQYKRRLLTTVRAAEVESQAHPERRIALVLNEQAMRTLKGWLSAGKKADLSVDSSVCCKPQAEPGAVSNLSGTTLKPVNLASNDPLPSSGILIIRHGETDWNGKARRPAPMISRLPDAVRKNAHT